MAIHSTLNLKLLKYKKTSLSAGHYPSSILSLQHAPQHVAVATDYLYGVPDSNWVGALNIIRVSVKATS